MGEIGFWRYMRKIVLFPEWFQRILRGKYILPYRGNGRLLDVGCGPGGNLKVAQNQGWDVYGVEMNEEAVAYARTLVGDRIHFGTLDTAPFDPEFFDVILFSHSLEHMFSPSKILSRSRELLKPSGMIAISLPNAGSWEAKVFHYYWWSWEIPRHLYHFEKSTLKKLLQKTGFKNVQCRTGVSTLSFMGSLDLIFKHALKCRLPFRKAVETLIASTFGLVSGHLGYGSELHVYAEKGGPS